MRFVLVAWLVAGAGCLLPDSAEVSGSGVTSERQHQSLHCTTDATLDRYAAGAGGLKIEVYDGAGATVYATSADVAGEMTDTRDVSGALGTWMLAVDAAGFAGQFKISLSCL